MRCPIACLLVLGAVFCPGQVRSPSADEPIGFVTRLEGAWRDESCNCRVSQGHTVLRRSRIIRQGAGSISDYLTISFSSRDGREEKLDCGTRDCREPLDLLKYVSDKQASQLSMLLRAALEAAREVFSADGEGHRTLIGYSQTLSRTAGVFPLADAIVAPEADGGLNLSAVFQRAPSRTLQLDWCEAGPTGDPACSRPVDPHPARATSDGSVMWRPPSSRPGLYWLYLCEFQGTRAYRGGNSAIVLVASSAAKAMAMRDSYDRFASLLAGQNSYDASMLLRAYLQHLHTEDR